MRQSHFVGGVGLIVVSAFFRWLPVLGWGTLVLGFTMIAGEVQPVVCFMDQLEVRLRRLVGPSTRKIVRLAAWA